MSILIKTSEEQSFWIDMAGSRFLVCPLTGPAEHKIDVKHTNFEAGRQQYDKPAAVAEKFKAIVQDWNGVEDIDGNEVPYTDDMRAKFGNLNPDYAELVLQKAKHRIIAKQKEEDDSLGEQ